ncbi:MAG TPA: hypothetical protein DCZ76_06645 [Treponema sp.]|nr:hypothetical protein [Treponema sp.]
MVTGNQKNTKLISVIAEPMNLRRRVGAYEVRCGAMEPKGGTPEGRWRKGAFCRVSHKAKW